MEEIWKDIEGYEGYYQISNLGNVKSLARNVIRSDGVIQPYKERIMDKRVSTDGYYIAKLTVNRKSKSIGIHILVARHFIPNPDNLPEVNHKDLDRKNNRVDNLEWCTHQDNVRYSWERGRYKGKSGEENPNFGNHKLSEIYKNDPALSKEKQSRPAEQNGRATSVRMYKDDFTMDFAYFGLAAKYMIDNNITKSKSILGVSTYISASAKNNKPYYGYNFELI